MSEAFELFAFIFGPSFLRSMWPYMMFWGPRKNWLDQTAESRWVTVWQVREGVPV